ncbi:hypothetical protein KW797_00005, partial [Candidatus Parcubacteria bacterium]|nr:hypothetical protein [Candidatus Parcubacteria bacterium]
MQKQNVNGTLTSEFHLKFINYLDATNQWKQIDLAPRATATEFVVDKAPYELRLPKSSVGAMTFRSTNKYSIKERRARSDGQVSKVRVFTSVQDVQGQITSEGVLYPGAMATIGADLLIQPHEQEVRWLVKWSVQPACLPNMNISIPFTETYDGGRTPTDGETAIGTSDQPIASLQVKMNDFRGIGTRPSFIWDSAGHRWPVQIMGRFLGGVFTGRKVVPCNFFLNTANIAYPVFTDDSSTFFPDPNVEVTTVDGRVGRNVVDTWANVQASTLGNFAGPSEDPGYVESGLSAGAPLIDRFFTLFDTSALPDAVTVTAATISCYVTAISNTDNDGLDYVTFVTATPATNT